MKFFPWQKSKTEITLTDKAKELVPKLIFSHQQGINQIFTQIPEEDLEIFEKTLATEYYVDSVAVYPEYRRHGIAGELLKVAKIKSSTYGFDKISLIVKPENKRAIALYENHGYAVRGKLTLAGIKYLSMIKSVDSKKALA